MFAEELTADISQKAIKRRGNSLACAAVVAALVNLTVFGCAAYAEDSWADVKSGVESGSDFDLENDLILDPNSDSTISQSSTYSQTLDLMGHTIQQTTSTNFPSSLFSVSGSDFTIQNGMPPFGHCFSPWALFCYGLTGKNGVKAITHSSG